MKSRTRPGDYDHDDFPEKPRCRGRSAIWTTMAGECCREAGHGGPHHYRLDPPPTGGLRCLVCGYATTGSPMDQVATFEEHMAAEHGVDI